MTPHRVAPTTGGEALCRDARVAFEAGDRPLTTALVLSAALRCWWSAPDAAGSAAVVAAGDELLPTEETAARLAALALAEPVLQAARVAESLSRLPADGVTDADALRLLGTAAHVIGDPETALAYLDRADTALRDQGRWGPLAAVCSMRALDVLELGDWDAALTAADEGSRLAEHSAQRVVQLRSRAVLAFATGLRGDNDRAQALAADVEWVARPRRLSQVLACVQLARAAGWMSAERYTEAYGDLRRMFDPADPSFHPSERFRAVGLLAEAAVHSGHADHARTVVADAELDATVTQSTTLRINVSYANAVLADADKAATLFTTATSADDLVRRPWARARLQLAAGAWLRRQRRVADSRDALRAAAATFAAMGADAWGRRARAELLAAGDPAGSADAPQSGLLSPQELQIARLAALGLTNRQIGERLFLSHRTVGSHLARIFPKLDITTRVSLAPRVAELLG